MSIIDIVLELQKEDITLDELNQTFKDAAQGSYQGIIDTNEDELVSVDYRGEEHMTVIDIPLNKALDGGMVKIVSWYDNEWGYARRVIDLIHFLVRKGL